MEKQNTDPTDWQKGHRSRERQEGRTNQDSRMIVKEEDGRESIERRREKV